MIVERDPVAEVAFFWRVVSEMRSGAVPLEEAFEDLVILATHTLQPAIYRRCVDILSILDPANWQPVEGAHA